VFAEETFAVFFGFGSNCKPEGEVRTGINSLSLWTFLALKGLIKNLKISILRNRKSFSRKKISANCKSFFRKHFLPLN